MKMFELLPRPLGSIFRKLTHLTCNSRYVCMDRAARRRARKYPLLFSCFVWYNAGMGKRGEKSA